MSHNELTKSDDRFYGGPFRILIRFELRQHFGITGIEELTVEMDLKTEWFDSKTLRITLMGVHRPTLRICSSGQVRIFLEIYSIRERQWDGLNYMLEDTECTADEEIAILCKSFTTETIEQQ